MTVVDCAAAACYRHLYTEDKQPPRALLEENLHTISLQHGSSVALSMRHTGACGVHSLHFHLTQHRYQLLASGTCIYSQLRRHQAKTGLATPASVSQLAFRLT